jgi:ABC-2 type transport system permease protein
MSTGPNAMIDAAIDAGEAAPGPATLSPTRPLYWSVRRELWENRSIYVGPLAVAAALLLGFLVTAARLPERVGELSGLELAQQYGRVSAPFHTAAGLPIVVAFLVGAFYCLDALHGERRDRSILFWKSLPVSDRTTVLSKASVPLVVLPAIVYPIIVVTQLVMLAVSSAVLLANGMDLAPFWERLPMFQLWLAILYALVAVALWHAPVYAWLLLVSAWARRAPLLWAVLPPLAVAAFERIAFGTSHVALLIRHRLLGWFTHGFVANAEDRAPGEVLTHLTPGRLLGMPGLWIGLLLAGAFLAAAVRLRRSREPI